MPRYKTQQSPRLIVLQSCSHPFSRQQGATYRASIVGSRLPAQNSKTWRGSQFPRTRAHTLGLCDHDAVRSRLPSRCVLLIRGRPTSASMILPSRTHAPRNRSTRQTDHGPRTAPERVSDLPAVGCPKTSDKVHGQSVRQASLAPSVTRPALRANCPSAVSRLASP
jgi:hypothetical protein